MAGMKEWANRESLDDTPPPPPTSHPQHTDPSDPVSFWEIRNMKKKQDGGHKNHVPLPLITSI
jgi:hypothetical protein